MIDLLIVLIASGFCAVDTVNGWMQMNEISLPLSISQIYKFPLLILFCSRIFLSKRVEGWYVLVTLFIFSFYYTYHSLSQNFIDHLADFTINLKVSLFFFACFYFVNLARSRPDFYRIWFDRIVTANFVALFINIVLGAFGFGFKQYWGGIGSVGFLYAGNEVSALMLFMATFIFSKAWGKGILWYGLSGILLFGMSVLAATKVAILGMMILFILVPLFIERKRFLFLNQKRLFGIAIGASLVFVAILLLPTLLEEVGLMNRWRFWYKKYDNDLITLLLSGRNMVFLESQNVLSNSYSFIDILFGKGYSNFVHLLSDYTRKNISVELDAVDVFYSYGIVGCFLLYGFYVWCVSLGFNNMNKSNFPMAPQATLFLMILVAVGLISGHVIFSGMGALFYGLAVSAIFYQSSETDVARN